MKEKRLQLGVWGWVGGGKRQPYRDGDRQTDRQNSNERQRERENERERERERKRTQQVTVVHSCNYL